MGIKKGETTRRFVGHTKDVLSCAFSADNRQIVSGSRDKTVKLWNTLGECSPLALIPLSSTSVCIHPLRQTLSTQPPHSSGLDNRCAMTFCKASVVAESCWQLGASIDRSLNGFKLRLYLETGFD